MFEELDARLEPSGYAFVRVSYGSRPRVHSTHETPFATISDTVLLYCVKAKLNVANPLEAGLTVVGQEGFEPP